MTELRNLEAELSRFRVRVLAASVLVLVCFGLVAARLVYLQVYRYEALHEQAESNRTAVVPIVPNRGLVLDRNGVILANNYSAYTLEITPARAGDLNATIDELARLVEITPRDRRRFKKQLEESKNFESVAIRTRLTDQEVARVAAQRFRFQGVEIKARLFRNYPLGPTASHLVGYIGRISAGEKERLAESEEEANYRGTDYIGKLGVEQSFERQLHGVTGVEEVETSASGRAVRKLANSPASTGDTVYLSIDIKLQHLIEDMFGDRRGALVAINPKNGEVIAFASLPTYDPNLFVEGIDQETWDALRYSIDKPLVNRALTGLYPPGSTYKPFMALAALHYGKRSPDTIVNDPGYFMFGNHRFRSHGDHGLGAVDMYRSIVKSSNVYYYTLANELGVDAMHDFMKPLGFGQLTGIDINGEVRGVLPSQDWKRKAYKRSEQKKWYPGETISLGIGQGYNSFTMLQLANATAALASGGQRFHPRVVVATQDASKRDKAAIPAPPAQDLGFRPEHVAAVRRGMVGVTQEGTSARAFAGARYLSGGKTGTAQAVGIGQREKYNAAKMEEFERDHSLYVAFAPAHDPQIALAVVVENSGFGSEHAAPIARRVFDYYLLGQYPSEQDLQAVRKGQATTPLGTPRAAAQVPLPAGAAYITQTTGTQTDATATPAVPATAAPALSR